MAKDAVGQGTARATAALTGTMAELATEGSAEVVAATGETPSIAPRMAALTSIDLSRHQICDDGAVALALALRDNVRVEVSKNPRLKDWSTTNAQITLGDGLSAARDQ